VSHWHLRRAHSGSSHATWPVGISNKVRKAHKRVVGSETLLMRRVMARISSVPVSRSLCPLWKVVFLTMIFQDYAENELLDTYSNSCLNGEEVFEPMSAAARRAAEPRCDSAIAWSVGPTRHACCQPEPRSYLLRPQRRRC